MKVNPYLSFDGRCTAAFKFYEQALGAKIDVVMPYRGSPMESQAPAGSLDMVMHARLTIGDQVLMGSDVPPDRYQAPQGITISLGIAEPAEAERVFHALAEGGTVQMPIQQTFWAIRFGMVTDQFGIPWMINCEQPA